MLAVMIGGLFLLVPISGGAPPQGFAAELYRTRWVCYAPTGYDPEVVPPITPSLDSIVADLKVLQKAGASGIITYTASVPDIVTGAASLGLKVLLGVWDPGSKTELASAVEEAKSTAVLGTIVGNEGLTFRRYDVNVLRRAMAYMKQETGKPVSTTEIIQAYFTRPELAEMSDYLAVNAHPFFNGRRDPRAGVEWSIKSYEALVKRFPRLPVLFKETGLPTCCAEGLSEDNQLQFYESLSRSVVQFAIFEAFDMEFKRKHAETEANWGVFHADRTPKPAATVIGSRLVQRAVPGR